MTFSSPLEIQRRFEGKYSILLQVRRVSNVSVLETWANFYLNTRLRSKYRIALCLFCLVFNPQEGSNMVFRNAGKLRTRRCQIPKARTVHSHCDSVRCNCVLLIYNDYEHGRQQFISREQHSHNNA